jgi:hypothetical protein
MKIAIATGHAGFALKERLRQRWGRPSSFAVCQSQEPPGPADDENRRSAPQGKAMAAKYLEEGSALDPIAFF